jgi:hypothetical protein
MRTAAAGHGQFITKRLVIVIGTGILQVAAGFFHDANGLQLRIEHGDCTDGKFLLDIVGDLKASTSIDSIDYRSGKASDIECRLNMNE